MKQMQTIRNANSAELSAVLGNSAVAMSPDPQEIAAMAYFAWERDGRPEGRNDQYWLEAESQLAVKFQSAAARQEKNGKPRRTVSRKTAPAPRT